DLKPEGPFGDHLGYYSKQHDFPYLRIRAVYHRRNAIWPFTVVGRPPQEDTVFGDLIHEITRPAVESRIPGVRQIHAVDVAGVHPLLLAVGSERYLPYAVREPMEILTQANALLGFGQVSLSKYLFIAAQEDAPQLDARDIPHYLTHVLERLHFSRDLHFQTSTTMDTLDYSGTSLHHGSKLVLACAGKPRRKLGHSEDHLTSLPLPPEFGDVRTILPGFLIVKGPPWIDQSSASREVEKLCRFLAGWENREEWPWITVVDDAEFAAKNLSNWLWVFATRSNPSHDLYGVKATCEHKHWRCEPPLVVDARKKSHHAQALEEDPETTRRVDEWFSKKGPLAGFF
ncbi:MAG TPA: UbiD family decarboxylase domain-containing protein, partial [Fibrobacteraceae bacterium]|nr:UbiD family decarboxylase domain-containing protein [Fibrobacteraceae bacterium]